MMPTAQDVIFMERAIALARQGKMNDGGSPFGAVIVQNGKIVAEVSNSVKADTDCTQHAELKAIQVACRTLKTHNLSDCVLYTSCVPCMMCLGACHWANFKAIFYGASALDAKHHGYVYSEMYYARDAAQRDKEFKMQQFMAKEAVAVWEHPQDHG
ncbi:nucleoside deaminase [Maribacter sp. 2307ULW6-5]|uniref:nucleoside deaminase n=1 Tax=Maribacter sp. 2307ULW6-5 TaxID=3386275 RepID=UPI0039BC5327